MIRFTICSACLSNDPDEDDTSDAGTYGSFGERYVGRAEDVKEEAADQTKDAQDHNSTKQILEHEREDCEYQHSD